MKRVVIFSVFLTLFWGATAQNDSIRQRECDRMRFLAGEELKVKNYAGAVSYYLKGEDLCGDFDKATYDRISITIQNAYNSVKDKEIKAQYSDTLLSLLDRMETKGFLDKEESLTRAKFILNSTDQDRKKADNYFKIAMENNVRMTEVSLYTYYSNVYMLYANSNDSSKEVLKKRLISEYLLFVNNLKNEKIIEIMKKYFNSVVTTCEDLMPDLKIYMTKLPESKEDKLTMINMFMDMISEMKCTDSPEYEMLVDSVIAIDNSIDAVLAKKKLLFVKEDFDGAIDLLKKASGMTENDSLKNAFEYEVMEITYFNKKSYKMAYNMALSMNSEYRSKALEIAADVVASMANSCGVSTFDRKCNYLYAAQLAERAGLSSKAQRYKDMGPSNTEKFENGNPTSATLSCWGVTVNL
jgi:hypothetical protein